MWIRLLVAFMFVCFSVFHTMSQKRMQPESPNLTEMFHHESWKPIYFGVKWSMSQGTKNNSVSIFRWNAVLTLAAYVSYAGFSCG